MDQDAATNPAAERDTHRLGHRVANSAALLWSFQMILRGLQFVTLIILARLLTPGDFGIVAIATTVIGVLDVLTNMQVGNAIVRSSSVTDAHLNTAFTLNMCRGVATGLILAVAAHPIALYMDQPGLEPILYVLIIPAVIGALANPYFILYGRNLDFRMEVRRRSLAAIVGSIASIAVAFIFRSYWALIVSTIVQNIVSTALSYWRVPGRPRLSLSHAREMAGFGGWLLVQNVLTYLALRLEYFYIGKLMNPKVLGAYHLGNQVNSMSSADIVPTLSRAMFPALSMLQKDPERLRRTYVQIQATSLAISLPIGFGLALLARPLILLLFGRGWETAVMVVWFITPVTSLQALGAGVEGLAMALNRVRPLAARSAVYVTVRTVLQLIGFFSGGLIGLLVGRTVAGIFQAIYGLSLAAKLTGRSVMEPLVASWRSFAAIAVMSAGLLVLPQPHYESLPFARLLIEIAWRAALGALLYCGTHMILWRMQGKPEGAETLILRQLARVTGRFKRSA